MVELSEYNYELPRHLIAQQPLAHRSDARLLVVHRARETIDHYRVRDLPQLLSPHDALVINDSRVVPAGLVGHRTLTGGRWEGLFLAVDEQGRWRIIAKTRGKVSPGESITLTDREGRTDVRLVLLERLPGGVWLAHPDVDDDTFALLARVGRVPLPHYVRGGHMVEADLARYQTVYARDPGSAAAPTAGLHFDEELLRQLIDAGIAICRVTLHVGLDTFRPIKSPTLEAHEIHREWGRITPATVEQIAACRATGGRVVAIGTTSVRVLESAARDGTLRPWQGETDLFIRPGHKFQAVDALLTNFHLPCTTLLVLVRTFGGDALIRRAYDEAIREGYRFYSYGDAMLIL